MPWKTYREGDMWCVHKLNADDSKGEKVKCFDSEEAAQAHQRALYANVNEFRGNFNDVLAITELRGSYPNVPIAADVDYAALIAGDDDPQFLTLPIGMVNAKSGNGRYYDEEFVTELMRQTLATKPIGLFGHLSETERATAFPKESLHWVGAARDGDGTAWGKAYIVPGETRQRLARYKAQGKSIATSIDAYAEGVWDETIKAHRMSAKSLRLNQIDLAPSDRAGISALARVPMLTTEMETEIPTPQEVIVDKLQVIQELTVADVRLLPDEVRAAILETVTTPPEVALVQELRQTFGVDDKADLTKLVTEMQATQAAQAKAAIAARITELVNDKDKGVKVESVRGLVTELVNARNPQTPQEAEAAYGQVVEMQSVKDTLAAAVQATMGPRQRTPIAAQAGQAKYFPIPQEAN